MIDCLIPDACSLLEEGGKGTGRIVLHAELCPDNGLFPVGTYEDGSCAVVLSEQYLECRAISIGFDWPGVEPTDQAWGTRKGEPRSSTSALAVWEKSR